jgi:spermidine synthase
MNHGVRDSSQINVIVEDGRNYLLRTRKKYSVITADPTHPILGSGNLYTREYYEQAYEKLEDDGLIVQYVPLHLLLNPEFRTLINTFNSVFEHSSLWYSSTDLVIMGSKRPLIIDYAKLERMLQDPVIAADLELSHMGTPPTLLGQLLMGNEEIREYAANSQINTDDHPIIEFRGPSSIGKNTRGDNLESILPHLSRTSDYVDLSGLSPAEQSETRAILARKDRRKRYILSGLMHDSRKEYGLAINEYRSALRLFPDDADTQRLLKDARTRFANKNR